MKKFILLMVAVLLTSSSVLAQERRISGELLDPDAQEAVMQATVQLLKTDSTFISGVLSDDSGVFKISAPSDGRFLLKVTSVGYKPLVKSVTIKDGKNMALGKINLKAEAIMLKAATVTGTPPKVTVKKDTFVYNAAAYRTPEGSVIEELVKKLPGAEVDDDGKITINGKEVKKVLVDGKEFMTGDTKTAMKNLPTSIINNIKAYDQKSDLARVTGIEDGKEETVLDFGIKPGMNRGAFTNLDAGIGTKDRYSWRGMGAYMNSKNRFMLFTNANNVGDRGFPGGGGGGRWGGGNNGLNSSKMIGANYNYEKKNKLKIDGSVRWNHNDGDAWNRQFVENFVSKTGAFSNSESQNYTRSNNWNIQGRLEWQPDTMTNIMFRPSLQFSTSDGRSWSNSASFKENPYLYVADPLAAASIESLAADDLMVNTRNNKNLSYSENTNINGTLQINRKLNNSGRNITLRGEVGYRDSESKSLSVSDVILYQIKDAAGNDSTYYTDRYNLTPTKNWNYTIQTTYSEPLWKRTYLQFSYQFQYKYSKSDRSTYDYSLFDVNPFAGVEQIYRGWDRYLSRIENPLSDEYYDENVSRYSEYRNYIHDINVNFRMVRDKYQSYRTIRVCTLIRLETYST